MILKNYAKLTRINQPTGILLLFLPCLFGAALAAKQNPGINPYELLRIILLFLVGSIIMRSAGCIINDILDRKFDKKVNRTKNRPLANNDISLNSAIILLLILLFFGLIILLQLNFATFIGGLFALILVAIYPLGKRFTNYPQVILGLTFNFGILMTSLAINSGITFSAILLYLAGIVWTLIYDTIYGFQDIEDDLKIGLKSTSIKFSSNPKGFFTICSLTMFLLLFFLGTINKFNNNFFFIILLASLFLDYKIRTCNLSNPKNCLAVFKSNIWVGILISWAIILG